jgi:hypothetical protein
MSALPEAGLAPQQAADELVARYDDREWLDAFAEALDRRRAGQALQRILLVWGLSQTAAGGLFGVTRQAVTKWRDGGVPTDRVEQVADVAAATDLLVRHLKRERIPAVVRRRAPGLAHWSLLELWAAGDTRRLLELTREMFTFGDAHG